MSTKTKIFKTDIDGKNTEFLVRTPSLAEQREGQKVYNQSFSDAVKAKAIVRARMDDLLEEQGLWDASKEKKLTELQQIILDNERALAKGGISLKRAKELAMEMKETRIKIRELIADKTSLDNHSAEGQADNARFNYLVSVCLVYNETKQPYFKNLEDYLSRSNEPVAILAAQNLANMLYGLDNDYEKNLPENKFLKKFKFVDDNLRLIDDKGRLVDADGRLIDENGRYINEAGEYIDRYGNRVDDKGDYIVEHKPFLDDNGNPIIENNDEPPKSEPTTPEKEEPATTAS
jgi:hypothetical protein